MTADALALELLARGGAVGAFLGLAIAVARGPMAPARVTGVLFCLAAAAHALTQLPAARPAVAPAYPVLWALSVTATGLFWAFAVELFEDRPRPAALRFAPAALLLAIGLAANAVPRPTAQGLWLLHKLVGAALMAHVLAVVWTGWRSDLVESRRRLRGPILAAGALYALTVVLVEAVEVFWRRADELSSLAALALLGLGLAGIAGFLRADPELFAAPHPATAPAPAATPAALSDEDGRLADRLERLMRQDRLYRQEALGIAALALKLEVPEHRLRRLINRRLGHRNFTAYLNRWRLADATAALADPAQREVPISTIALDAGYGSLGPFNRAFKAETGLTPTEYRARALATPAA